MTAMNDPITEPVPNAAAKCCADVEQRIRRNPGTTLLIAVGAGLAIGLLVRALQDRVARLLKDVEHRVRKATGPALHNAGELAEEGAEAVRDGLHSGGARLGHFFSDGSRKLRHLFQKA